MVVIVSNKNRACFFFFFFQFLVRPGLLIQWFWNLLGFFVFKEIDGCTVIYYIYYSNLFEILRGHWFLLWA